MLRIFGLLTPSPAVSPEPASTPASTPGDQESAAPPAASAAEPEPAVPLAGPSQDLAPAPRPGTPRLFMHSNYVAAVRASDGAILSHGVAAMPGEVIELYGTGFEPDAPAETAPDPEALPGAGNVTLSIGGIPADIRFAGRVGPKLFQIDATVPAGLPGGDHPVVASFAGMHTNCGALLKVAGTSEAMADSQGRYTGFLRRALEANAAAKAARS